MRKMILGILLLLMSVTAIHAATYVNDLPSGKNYLDSNNFVYGNDTLGTINPFKVKENQTYTLTIPRAIDRVTVEVTGDQEFLSGEPWTLPECSDYNDVTYCTFSTTNATTDLSVEISGGYLSNYLDDYGMYLFQLEEGSVSTEYEGYIPPDDVSGPTLSGAGTYITSYRDQSPIEDIISNHVTAIDEKEGDVSDTIVIITDNYTENRETIGEYSVIIQANDSHNNISQFKLIVIVKDEYLPTISGPNELVTNVDQPDSLEALLTNYTSTDEYDGSLTIEVEEENYTTNTDIIGSYSVTISSTDLSGNKETIPVVITIEDTVSPVVTSSTSITQYIASPISIATILNELSASDNYNVESDITKEITRDSYSEHNTSKGVYEVDVLLTDTSGNQSTTTISITVLDDISPIISGPNSIVLSYQDMLDISDIKALYTLYDNESLFDYDDLIVVSENYSANRDQLGEYLITFELTDDSSNTSTKTLNISVIDDVGPVLTTDDYIISVSSEARVTNNDLIGILLRYNKVEDKDYDVEVTLDEYTSNVTVPGTYKYQINLIDPDGNIEHKDFLIKVEDSIVDTKIPNETGVLVRNIIVYSSIVTLLVVLVIKTKKK